MKKKIFFIAFTGILLLSSLFTNAQGADPVEFNKPVLKAVYNSPATAWTSSDEINTFLTTPQPVPIGNGYIGGMVYGGVANDMIQMNEHTLWSGGPGKNPNYNGGHRNTASANHLSLQNARKEIQNNVNSFSETKAAYIDPATGKVVTNNFNESSTARNYVNQLKGNKTDFGSYQSLGNINIAYPQAVPPVVMNVATDAENQGGEKAIMLFDGNITSKWYADQGFKKFPCYVAWDYDVPFSTNTYTVCSGNDVPERDPIRWKLYGSNTGQENDYTLIKEESNVNFTERRQTLSFPIGSTVTFQYFKFEILATRGNNPPQLSEITLINANESQLSSYSGYRRELDLDNGVVTVKYNGEGVNYTRQYFASYPDNIMLVRLTADQPNKLSRVIWLTTPQSKKSITVENGVITMIGQPSDQTANGLKFAQQVKVIPIGGSMGVNKEKISVTNADEIIIITAAATNYVQCTDETFNYFSGTDPLSTVQTTINTAVLKGYSTLLANHLTDYQSLYNRMGMSLGASATIPEKTTDQLLIGYRNNSNITADEKLYLEMLYYQFGRYLLISSSRENTLPANLQGIWADGLNPPWAADYHTNINVQMNYWLAQQTNLSSCHLPVIKYTRSLVPRGKQTAKLYHCKPDGGDVRGWVIYHENNIWGNTAPATSDAFYFPAAAAWMCLDIWDYYLFNSDKQFLEENFDVLLDAALFWVDNLWRDTRDGSLVANPSYSPEHGPYTVAASCDQAIIWEIFDIVIKAGEILNYDIPEINEIKTALGKLAGPQIGLNGQFMEWKDETTMDVNGDGGHRHVNHLFWLHPGSQIIAGRSGEEDRYVEAMKKTLNTRGDGGTGWSKAWKINFWARLRDGNHSHKLVEEILKESTLYNLFDTHPPFQIDGNFGATSGMTEMLVQSQGNCIEVLPALPDVWSTGVFKGIKARGNFEINCKWNNKALQTMEITSNSGNICVLRYNDIQHFNITQQGGGAITPTIIAGDKISFPTTKGATYIISKL